MKFDSELAIRILTMLTLVGLLLEVGLRVTWSEVRHALRSSRLRWILPANFIWIPLLTIGLARVFQLPPDIAVGMTLLAAAPFAPVVPTFTKMARGDLALAAGLTAIFPFIEGFITPIVCQGSLKLLPGTGPLHFDFALILVTLVFTITFPLIAGLAIHHWLPGFGKWILFPLEIVSQGAGALSLAFVTIVEFSTIAGIGWKSLLVMTLIFEISLLTGYALSGPRVAARRVVALGTSNRNIALAILIAIGSFPHSPVVAAVVGNGLVMILLGLLHVGFWRFFSTKSDGHLSRQ